MNESVFASTITNSKESGSSRVAVYLKKRIAALHPAYFALVMATGIVSISCYLLGLPELSMLLFWINIAAFCILSLLYAARASLFTANFIQDLFSHKRAFGFFTVVAATNVLGSQFMLLADNSAAAEAFWWLGLILWIALTYTIFVFLIVAQDKPSLEEGINGGWLVAVVATQSVCVLGCIVKPELLGSGDLTALLLLSFWLFGGMLYIWTISLIFYRYMFFRFEPSHLIPPYWINMGAMAITTLAGCELITSFGNVQPVAAMVPFLKGFTVMYWATATWWIPMLLVLGIWRHCVRGFKFQYDPLYWGLVFPLGMYSVCTLKLGAILEVSLLSWIAHLFLVLGLIAWTITFLSMSLRPLYAAFLALRPSRQSAASIMEVNCDELDRQ
jgi:tellurite resistance protein TehA-like permease